MLITNKLDRSFGKFAFMPGVIILILGCLTILKIWPVLFIITGAFIAFTHSGAQLETEKKEVRLYQNLFGIFKTGKWQSLNLFKGLTIIPVRRLSRMMSMSNRSTSFVENDYRIFLVNKSGKPEFPIRKCKTLEDAHDRIDELSLWLKMPVYTVK